MGGAFAELAEDGGDEGAVAASAHAGIHSVAVSVDGSTMATGDASGFIAVWEVEMAAAPRAISTSTKHTSNDTQGAGEE